MEEPACTHNNRIEVIDENTGNEKFALFDCRGEVNVKQVYFPNSSYLKTNERALLLDISLKKHTPTNICCDTFLFGKRWDCGSVLYKHLDILFKMASRELMQIDDGTNLYNSLGTNAERLSSKLKNHKISRLYCVELYIFIQEYIKSLCTSSDFIWMLQEIFPVLIKKLNSIQRQLKRLVDLPDYVYLHGCSALGNESTQPSYHLLHVHLDLRWLNITSLLYLSQSKEHMDFISESSITPFFCDLEGFYANVQQLIYELFDIIIKRYEKIEVSSLCKKSPFVCTCVQELWALLQILTDSLYKNNKGKKFWDFISEYINRMNGFGDDSVFQENDENAVYSNLSCTARITCSLWALCNIAKLYQLADYEVISCYPLLEALLKAIGIEDMCESIMRVCLSFIEQICLAIWEPKVEPIVSLWEYFQKKLNNHFYIPGTPPDSLAVVSKSARGLLNQVKSFLNDVNSVRDSFQHFLRLLGLHLKKTKEAPKHWRLIKARIFTKLSPANVANLSHIGEYHFVSLFLTIALTLGYKQVGNKMIDLANLSNMNAEFIKGQLAVVLVILEEGGNAECAIKPVVEHINTLSAVEHIDTMRLYTDAVQDILQSHDCLTLGQHVLIDVWLSKYLSYCPNSDCSKLLSAVSRFITRESFSGSQKIEPEALLFADKIWGQLELYLSLILTSSQTSAHDEVSDIAAALAALYLNQSNQDKFKNIFTMLLRHEIADIRLIIGFLSHFIHYFGMNTILPCYNKIIIKAWLRCCFLYDIKDSHKIRQITTFISTLSDIKQLFEGTEESLCNSEEPLLLFFMCLQNKFLGIDDIYKKQSLREKLFGYLDGLENWIKPIINNPRNVDQVKRLFSTVGNMFRLIAPLLYVKSKPNTLLQLLIDQLLLPFNVHNPETSINGNIIAAIKGSLHLYIQGLIQLCPEEDHYVLRTLKELITVYIPRCVPTSNSNVLNHSTFPLIGEFRSFDTELKAFILNTVCNSFLKRKARRPINQAIYGLIFIREIMKTHGRQENVFLSLITCTFERICDVIMYCENSNQVHKLAKEIIKLYLNSNSLRINRTIMDEVTTALTLISNENLAWSSRQMFDLLTFLSSEAPDIIMDFLPKLQELIKEVELKRGVGYDKVLRINYEKIETNLRTLLENIR